MLRRVSLIAIALLIAGGCQRKPAEPGTEPSASSSVAAQPSIDPLAAHDDGGAVGQSDPEHRPVMQVQVVLDRLGFTPGVIDGKEGLSTRNAIEGFQEANDLAQTGELDPATLDALRQWQAIPATRMVTIPAAFAAGPFMPVPKEPEDQATMPALGYASLDEKLAERFHTTVETLRALNPPAAATNPSASVAASGDGVSADESLFAAGQTIRVPNVGHDRVDAAQVKDPDWLRTLISLGVGTDQPKIERIVVSKSKGTLRAYDAADKLVAVYTATMGSQHDPLPLGRWKVNGISFNPKFHYNPALFWDASPGEKKATLPPGPNGPVGVVWIDLSKPHYGIHGTPRPETIGRAESHGCVRLTNWDAARLAQMVHAGTTVLFET